MGRLHPQKGVTVLLHAFSQLADRFPRGRFVCIGKTWHPDHTQDLHDLATSLGLRHPILRWLPAYPDMPAAYNAFDLTVSASFQEGFANNIAEALACGTPCVVTDVGDNARVVADPDLVVEPGDADALSEACTKAIDTRLPADRDAVRERVLGYGIDVMVDRTA